MNGIFNRGTSRAYRTREDTFQPVPHTVIPSAVSSFNRKVAFGSRLYIHSYSRGFLNLKYILKYFFLVSLALGKLFFKRI